MATALITGISGQDGSYLTELLLSKGYEVHGFVRRTSSTSRSRIDHLFANDEIYNKRLFLHYSDLDDATTIRRLITQIRPSEVYHLAGQSHVGASFDIPESTCDFTAMGTLRLLEILRDLEPRPRLLHMSSSEIFGRPQDAPQDESTRLNPVSPYGVAKAFATQMVRVYRESFGFFACNAICYNHESPRRGESFVTRKISLGVARIKHGVQDKLTLGSLDSQRDWGFAAEYVEAFWKMLQCDEPDDYVISTGKRHSIQDYLEAAFGSVDLDWRDYVETDPRYLRPAEAHSLVGDSSKAKSVLGWEPKTDFKALVALMVAHDMDMIAGEKPLAPPEV